MLPSFCTSEIVCWSSSVLSRELVSSRTFASSCSLVYFPSSSLTRTCSRENGRVTARHTRRIPLRANSTSVLESTRRNMSANATIRANWVAGTARSRRMVMRGGIDAEDDEEDDGETEEEGDGNA